MLEKYNNNIKEFLHKHPEIEFGLLELDFNISSLIDFINIYEVTSVKEFSIKEFRDFLESRELDKNQTRVSYVFTPNPRVGDLAYEPSSNHLHIFNGDDWIVIK